jgi:hypothetical protein
MDVMVQQVEKDNTVEPESRIGFPGPRREPGHLPMHRYLGMHRDEASSLVVKRNKVLGR